jgi:hypothetical protein
VTKDVARKDNSAPTTSIASLLGPSPVLLGEDPTAFEALRRTIADSVKPTDAIEEIWARDVAELVWEVGRLRRLKAALLLAHAHAGMFRLLKPLVGAEADALAGAWARRDPAATQRVASLLAQCGFTADAIMAETLAGKLQVIERFESMIAAAEARRAVALREIERHRTASAVALRAAAKEIEDAEFQEVAAQGLSGPRQ